MRPRPAIRHFVGTAVLAAGCAAAQVHDDHAGDFVVFEETFDPAAFRQDLLLIEPLFPPPEVRLPAPAAVTPAPPETLLVHRVQVIALSRLEGAEGVARHLARRLGVPVDVVPQGPLHAVRAGRFRDPRQAGLLKGRIALLGDEYAGAYVVTDSVLTVGAGDLATPGPDSSSDDGLVTTGDEPREEAPVELVRTSGWRVLLGQFRDHGDAIAFQRSSMRRLRREDVDVKFQAPWYKVLTGNFRREADAQHLVERVRAHYRNATKTRGEVFLPREEIDRR